MTFGFFKRRLALLAAVSSALLLAACGGGDDNNNSGSGGQTTVRAVNLTTEVASVDLYTGDTRRFAALAPDVMAPNVSFEANTYTLAVKRAGDTTTTLYSDSFSLSRDRNYTAVIAGRESNLVVRTIPENEDTAGIAAGQFRVRVFNLITDSGGVDVFVVPATTVISDATTPTVRFTNNTLSDFFTFTTANTHRVLVTGQGNLRDVRLDLTLTGAADKQFHTLVLTSGPSGALVNATLIPQGGIATSLKNTKARVRVAAGGDGNANIVATVAGNTIGGGALRSPNVSPYQLVDAGDRNLTVTLNGSTIANATRNFAAGADYTVLAYGSVITPRFSVLSDDNRAPSATTRAKIRLVNVAEGSEAMSLRADFESLVTGITAGSASAYFNVTSATSARLEVTTPGAGTLYTLTSSGSQPLLQAQGVYTLFMLGGNAQPTGVLNKDR